MSSNNSTGYETYIYDHKQYPGNDIDTRLHQGVLHNPGALPPPMCNEDTSPLIMVEPSYASDASDVFIMCRHGVTLTLSREVAEQLRDALIKVCKLPLFN